MTKAKTKRRTKAKGVLFDNREKPIRALDEAAEVYFQAMQARLPLSAAESEAKESLISLMVKHRRHAYKTADGMTVSLTDSHNVKVKPPSGESEAS